MKSKKKMDTRDLVIIGSICLMILSMGFVVFSVISAPSKECGCRKERRHHPPAPRPQGNGTMWPPDILNNQYAHPVRDTKYVTEDRPRSISTNIGYVNTSYRPVGILVPNNNNVDQHKPAMLILMGRPLYVNRNKWQYYAITDQRNGLKLTVRIKGKPATNEYGVDELTSTERVMVQGYNHTFRVDLYENDYDSYSDQV